MFKKILIVLLLSLILAFSGCFEKKHPSGITYRPVTAETLTPLTQLDSVELELPWSHVVPMDCKEKLRDFKLLDDKVYAISNRNYYISVERKNGDLVYGWQLAKPNTVVCGLKKYNQSLYSIAGSDLMVFDPVGGTKLAVKDLGFSPICPPARNKEYYYVGATDQRVHALKVPDVVEVFQASANDGASISCVSADDNMVIFTTDAGSVVAMKPDSAVQVWRFKADAAINPPVVWSDNKVFFSSRDTYVYALDKYSGKIIWKSLTSAILTEPPSVTDNYVYQRANSMGLLAIEKKTGKLAWKLDDGLDMLAEHGNKVYVMAAGGRIVVMDNKKLAKIGEVNVPLADKWISNTVDSRIYLADSMGRMECIKPIDF